MEKYRQMGDLRILESEEKLLRHIAPIGYVDQSLKNSSDGVKDDYLINFMQDELREVLQSFLNGGLSTFGYVAYPFIQQISPEIKERISRISAVASILKQRGGKIAPISFPQSIAGCADTLSSLYGGFENIRELGGKSAKKGPCERFAMNDYPKGDTEYLSPLSKIQESAQSIESGIKGMYLHGSLATCDFVKGWSDCDTLCVVAAETIERPKKLLQLRSQVIGMRSLFCQIDPLQHHGALVISEHDLESYPQTYFPLPLFGFAKAFGKDEVEKVRLRDHRISSYAKLFWFVSFFRRMHVEKRYALNAYETKNLLHLIALFPSLYLQTKDVLTYKKFSFGIAKKEFSNELWRPIEEMTAIRNRWKEMPIAPGIRQYARLNPFVAYQANAKLIDAAGQVRKLRVDSKMLVEGMHLLAEEAWKRAVRKI